MTSVLGIKNSECLKRTETKPFLNSKGKTCWIKTAHILWLGNMSQAMFNAEIGLQLLCADSWRKGSDFPLSAAFVKAKKLFRKPWGLNSASSNSVSENQLLAQRLGIGPTFGFQTSLRYQLIGFFFFLCVTERWHTWTLNWIMFFSRD